MKRKNQYHDCTKHKKQQGQFILDLFNLLKCPKNPYIKYICMVCGRVFFEEKEK